MKNYLVKIHFNVRIGDENNRFEEQIRLFRAESARQAVSNAVATGKNENELFTSETGELIEWRFVSVSDIICLDDLNDTDVIYNIGCRKADPLRYENFLRLKENNLEAKTAPLSLIH